MTLQDYTTEELRAELEQEMLKLNEAFIKFTFADGEPFGVKLK